MELVYKFKISIMLTLAFFLMLLCVFLVHLMDNIIPITSEILIFTSVITLISALTFRSINDTFSNQINKSQKMEMDCQIRALNAHSIIVISDIRGCIVHVNENFLTTTGYNKNELIGKPISILFYRISQTCSDEIIGIKSNFAAWTGETHLKHKSGKKIYAHTTVLPQKDKHNNVIGNISIHTDITKCKEALEDESLRKSLYLLRDEVYIFEPETLRFLYLNLAATRQTGWNEAKYAQKTLLDVNIGFDGDENEFVSAFNSKVRPLICGEVQELAFELLFHGKPNEVKLQLIHSESGEPRFVAIARDISERKQFEKKKEDFISTINHELRTPVTSIKGALGLVLSGTTGELSDKAKDMLEIAYRNTDMVALIINDILDLEKIAAGHMDFNLERVNIANLIAEAIITNKPFADRFGVSMICDDLDKEIIGYCDQDRVLQVMNNLLSNAAKFSEKKGDVVVALSETEKTVRICVEDFGIGIPEEAQDSIFERFTQVTHTEHSVKGGTGLGLSIVKAIINKQNGTVGFTSKVGKGSKFYFELPKQEKGVTDLPARDISFAAE